ncbi:hypothetical protein MTR_8g051870 [Medicago truncatula]|uniref:Uncharacterized protein n=1 Tax=Medicago truncatula TaxID=3880 RepID=G7L9A6_MEDTR|nr:hypothetical protein MTR_8g051870 [Medicago truncatula]
MCSSLNESFSEDEVLRRVHARLLCVEENADDLDVLPNKPAYNIGTRVFEEETYGEYMIDRCKDDITKFIA